MATQQVAQSDGVIPFLMILAAGLLLLVVIIKLVQTLVGLLGALATVALAVGGVVLVSLCIVVLFTVVVALHAFGGAV